jgi:hypothetical protein
VFDGKYVIAAIHDFCPSLPWYIYNTTQAVVHLFVMNAFERHLARMCEASLVVDTNAERSAE